MNGISTQSTDFAECATMSCHRPQECSLSSLSRHSRDVQHCQKRVSSQTLPKTAAHQKLHQHHHSGCRHCCWPLHHSASAWRPKQEGGQRAWLEGQALPSQTIPTLTSRCRFVEDHLDLQTADQPQQWCKACKWALSGLCCIGKGAEKGKGVYNLYVDEHRSHKWCVVC